MRISDWSSDVCSSDLFSWPTISDKANQSVAAQCPVLQKEIVSSAGLSSSRAAICLASSVETNMDVPGLNHLSFSRLTAFCIVPGTLAVGALVSPRKKLAGRASTKRVCGLSTLALTCSVVAMIASFSTGLYWLAATVAALLLCGKPASFQAFTPPFKIDRFVRPRYFNVQ